MRLLLIKFLTNIGLTMFDLGCEWADKWGLHDEIWTKLDPGDDEDDPENPLDDIGDMDTDPIAKEKL